jgi:hypothetical protein
VLWEQGGVLCLDQTAATRLGDFSKNLGQNAHGQQIFNQEGTDLLILFNTQINTEKNSSCTSPIAHKKREPRQRLLIKISWENSSVREVISGRRKIQDKIGAVAETEDRCES